MCLALLATNLQAATQSNAAAPVDNDSAAFRERYFEVYPPANFIARVIDAASPRHTDAATFTASDGTMSFYVLAPLWAGDAPEIEFVASRETETNRKIDAGKRSGVAGKYSWVKISAKDKSYTRLYQHFNADDGSIHWVIGMKYQSEEALQRYKGSLKNTLRIWPLDWDAMQGAKRAVWRATQAIRNAAVRPIPASQMRKLFRNVP